MLNFLVILLPTFLMSNSESSIPSEPEAGPSNYKAYVGESDAHVAEETSSDSAESEVCSN